MPNTVSCLHMLPCVSKVLQAPRNRMLIWQEPNCSCPEPVAQQGYAKDITSHAEFGCQLKLLPCAIYCNTVFYWALKYGDADTSCCKALPVCRTATDAGTARRASRELQRSCASRSQALSAFRNQDFRRQDASRATSSGPAGCSGVQTFLRGCDKLLPCAMPSVDNCRRPHTVNCKGSDNTDG